MGFICKSCPDKAFVNAGDLVKHVEKVRADEKKAEASKGHAFHPKGGK